MRNGNRAKAITQVAAGTPPDRANDPALARPSPLGGEGQPAMGGRGEAEAWQVARAPAPLGAPPKSGGWRQEKGRNLAIPAFPSYAQEKT